jgi:hypothetical protein
MQHLSSRIHPTRSILSIKPTAARAASTLVLPLPQTRAPHPLSWNELASRITSDIPLRHFQWPRVRIRSREASCMSCCVHSPRTRVRNRAVREPSPRCPWAYRLRRHFGTCRRGFLLSVRASGARAMLRRRLKAAPTHASRRRQLLAALVSRLTQKKTL